MQLLKERGRPWYWNEAFLKEIFCWIKPKSKSDIWAISNKKAMLDARLLIVDLCVQVTARICRIKFLGKVQHAKTAVIDFDLKLRSCYTACESYNSDFQFCHANPNIQHWTLMNGCKRKQKPRVSTKKGALLLSNAYKRRSN